MIERDVKKALKAFLTEIGAYQYWPVPMGMGAAAIDCFFCYRGRFYGVETKRPGVAKATLRQNTVLEQIAACGGGVCVENDPNLPNVRALLS